MSLEDGLKFTVSRPWDRRIRDDTCTDHGSTTDYSQQLSYLHKSFDVWIQVRTSQQEEEDPESRLVAAGEAGGVVTTDGRSNRIDEGRGSLGRGLRGRRCLGPRTSFTN